MQAVIIITSSFIVLLNPSFANYNSTGLCGEAHNNNLLLKERSASNNSIITIIVTCRFNIQE